MHAGQWSQDFSDWLGAYLSGWHAAETGERGRPVRDGAWLALPGASQGPIEPPVRSSAGLGDGSPRIDTAITTGDADRHCDAASALESRQVSRLAVQLQGEAAR